MNNTRLSGEQSIIALIMVGFIVLALGFSLGPIFEAPDEIEHYRYVRQVQRVTPLPNPAGQPFGQYHQAPLYYWLLQPLALLVPDDPDFEQIDGRTNPNHGYRETLAGNDNKNVYLHTRAEGFPYTDSPTARAVHVMRLLSVVFGALTVWVCYRIVMLLWPHHPHRRVLAVALVAFFPQFIYMSAVINNDGLSFLIATLTLYLLLYQHQHEGSWRVAVALGMVLGAGILTKSSLLVLALPVGIATLLDRRLWPYATLTLILTLLIGGWWYARNQLLYQDWAGTASMFAMWEGQAVRGGQFAFDVGLRSAPYAYGKLWARFGYGAVSVAPWLYRLFDGMVLIASVGLLGRMIALVRQRRLNRVLIEQIVIVTVFALTWVLWLIVSASAATAGNQGRYLLGGIATIGIFLALGISFWIALLPQRARNVLFPALNFALFLLAGYILLGHFFPAYRTVPMPDQIDRPINLRYDNHALLLGTAPAEWQARPGEAITIELYWQALQPASSTLQMYLHAIDGEQLLWRDSVPGNGHRPADDWQAGERWVERFVITIPPDAVPDTRYVVVAGFYDPVTGQSPEAFDGLGNNLSNTPMIAYLTVMGE
ncbi:MAG: glycosyltransferase family 39 protein [Anaerolineae bacterium]